MDGYNAEWSQFTVQNQVNSFNRRRLHHVKVPESPPAFPVGSESENSLLNHPSLPSPFLPLAFSTIPLSLPLSLHPFSPLPPQPGVVVQKKQGHRVKRLSSLLDSSFSVSATPPPDPPPPRRIHPAIQSAIQTYHKSSLQHVQPVVKATLPTSEGRSSLLVWYFSTGTARLVMKCATQVWG